MGELRVVKNKRKAFRIASLVVLRGIQDSFAATCAWQVEGRGAWSREGEVLVVGREARIAPASLTTIHLSKIAKREDALESSWTLAYKEASSEADSRVLKRKTRGPTAKIQSAQSTGEEYRYGSDTFDNPGSSLGLAKRWSTKRGGLSRQIWLAGPGHRQGNVMRDMAKSA